MYAKLRPFVLPLILAVLAIAIFNKRVRHEMVDFAVYRQAAARSLRAEPLYRPEDGHYQFKYLPAFALVMAPFAKMDDDTAKMVWFALSFGLLAVFVRWSVAALPARRLSERALIWVAIVLMAKFYAHELLLGQSNLLLGSLLIAALLAIQIERPRLGGVLLGLAIFVKPYAIIFVPWLAITQGLVPTLLALGVLGVGLIAPAALYGWSGNVEQLRGWYRTVTDSTAPNLLGADNISLAAMWAKWLGPGRTAGLLAAASGAGALALVAAAWRRRTEIIEPEYLEYALLMLLVPLLSPQGWDYVLLLATPAVLCIVDRWRETNVFWRVFMAVALALMCLTIFDVMGRALYARFMALSIVTVCALAIGGGLLHVRWRKLA